MLIAWPASLPQKPVRGFAMSEEDNVDRFDTDYGPPLTMGRSTSAGRTYSVTFVMTNAQKATFRDWYKTTLRDGLFPFWFAGPDDHQPGRWIMTGPPQYSAVGAKWQVSLEIYRYP
ncbi:hypothetical protein [Rhodoligotrophos ferricapiens]|uniref:hypothetical protein n=1 Tax=Rhodoligotrophos ferricapiens TaxID=3069264 RepID=UPI00315CC1BC